MTYWKARNGAAAMAGALAIGTCWTGAASAQTPTPAGELMAREAEAARTLPAPTEEAMTVTPASCGSANCLTLEISEDALRMLDRGAEPAALAEGLTLSYESSGDPIAVYFVAARYENGRLARYAYTPWVRPENGEGARLEGIAEALTDVVDPFEKGEARIVAASRSAPLWTVPVHTQSFMRESPRTYLLGTPEEAPVDAATAPADLAEAAADGSLVLLMFAPSDPGRRAPDQAAVTGVILPVDDGE